MIFEAPHKLMGCNAVRTKEVCTILTSCYCLLLCFTACTDDLHILYGRHFHQVEEHILWHQVSYPLLWYQCQVFAFFTFDELVRCLCVIVFLNLYMQNMKNLKRTYSPETIRPASISEGLTQTDPLSQTS